MDEGTQLCRVTVVPDQGWTVPAGTPEVPERIEEWPEDDTALRKYRWRCNTGDIWLWDTPDGKWHCIDLRTLKVLARFTSPDFAPFTRVTDA